jgi:hypothetical protein
MDRDFAAIDGALQEIFYAMVRLITGTDAEPDDQSCDEVCDTAANLLADGCECLAERGNDAFEAAVEELTQRHWELAEYRMAILDNAEWDAEQAKARRIAKKARQVGDAPMLPMS